MKTFEVERKTCRKCAVPMQVNFFVYASETERHDRWLESAELVEKYCDSCFRDNPRVMLFVEFFCPECGAYTGIYMECTPYSTAHFLSEKSVSTPK